MKLARTYLTERNQSIDPLEIISFEYRDDLKQFFLINRYGDRFAVKLGEMALYLPAHWIHRHDVGTDPSRDDEAILVALPARGKKLEALVRKFREVNDSAHTLLTGVR